MSGLGTADGWLERRLAPLIGRETELVEIDRLLDETRMLTITGTGGVGKTRLAIEVAARRRRSCGDVVFVDLSAIAESELVGGAVLASLGVSEEPGATRSRRSPIDFVFVEGCSFSTTASRSSTARRLSRRRYWRDVCGFRFWLPAAR
jgi:hypothetical protein